MLVVKWCGLRVIFLSATTIISQYGMAHFSCLLMHFCLSLLWDLRILWAMFAPVLFTYFSASHLPKPLFFLAIFSVMECVLVACSFPSLSLPLSMGTLGLRQSSVAMAVGRVAELGTPGIWSLSFALRTLSFQFIPPFCQVFFGAAEVLHPSVLFRLLLSTATSPMKVLSHT